MQNISAQHIKVKTKGVHNEKTCSKLACILYIPREYTCNSKILEHNINKNSFHPLFQEKNHILA